MNNGSHGKVEDHPLNHRWNNNNRIMSDPWLQKPLHAALAETPIKTEKHLSSSAKESPPSYHSFDRTVGDDVVVVTDPQNSGVVGVMKEDNHNNNNNNATTLERHLSLVDLVSIGVGGTIGSGIFVLCGFIAHNYAGPATALSFAIAGVAAMLSGLCYGELSCRMPSAGSSYIYVYVSMGELPAFLVAACLTLEYTVAASAVARSWGDKLLEWMSMELHVEIDPDSYWMRGSFNPMAALIATLAVTLLLQGVKESKSVTNFFTVTKVGVVAFMALVGIFYIQPSTNLTPLIPPQFGMAGVLRGATSSFFGYLGFDEICCIAGEAIAPQRNMPRAIILTLACVTLLYCFAAFALTGMQPYTEISEISGFPVALYSCGANWAAHLGAFGEVFTLPIVVLITIMAQPRLQYALAQDGLIPPIFAKMDATGNLWYGTLISGIVMIIIAALVPFTHLNDMISAAVLVAFSMTDSSLLLLRHESPTTSSGRESFLLEKLVFSLNISSFVLSICWTHFHHLTIGLYMAYISSFVFVMSCVTIYWKCPEAPVFGGTKRTPICHRRRHTSQRGGPLKRKSSQLQEQTHPFSSMDESQYFKTPFLPFFPSLGIMINWYLISQLQLAGIFLLLLFLALAAILYFAYGAHHSVGNNGGWDHYYNPQPNRGSDYYDEPDPFGNHPPLIDRTISLPYVS